MILTKKQEEGLKTIISRYKAGERYTTISGYAGSGKTTLVKFAVGALIGMGVKPDEIGFATYTGKAAQVLIDKGNKNAVTLHKLLFKAQLMPNGRYRYFPRDAIDYRVVVVDECSMAPASLVRQLAGYNCYCIFVGDPFQLPPIYANEDNRLLYQPHVFLDEIMRQAQDSGIIRLSMLIREGLPYGNFRSAEANVIKGNEITNEALLSSNINLCATNKTRVKLNQYIRGLLGYSGAMPNENEKIICLHNEWDVISNGGNALTNGCIGYLTDIYDSYLEYPYSCYKKMRIKTINGNFVTETGDDFGDIYTDKNIYLTGETTLTDKEKYPIVKTRKYMLPMEFDFAYAITTWKAQGSEWEKVLVLEEGFPHNKEEHQRFLYTAVTRASKEVTMYVK